MIASIEQHPVYLDKIPDVDGIIQYLWRFGGFRHFMLAEFLLLGTEKRDVDGCIDFVKIFAKQRLGDVITPSRSRILPLPPVSMNTSCSSSWLPPVNDAVGLAINTLLYRLYVVIIVSFLYESSRSKLTSPSESGPE